jgi:hypothetical protein
LKNSQLTSGKIHAAAERAKNTNIQIAPGQQAPVFDSIYELTAAG